MRGGGKAIAGCSAACTWGLCHTVWSRLHGWMRARCPGPARKPAQLRACPPWSRRSTGRTTGRSPLPRSHTQRKQRSVQRRSMTQTDRRMGRKIHGKPNCTNMSMSTILQLQQGDKVEIKDGFTTCHFAAMVSWPFAFYPHKTRMIFWGFFFFFFSMTAYIQRTQSLTDHLDDLKMMQIACYGFYRHQILTQLNT